MNYILTLERKYFKTTHVTPDNVRHGYTIGNLYDNDGIFICNTLEDVDRGLDSSMAANEIQYYKIKGETAIPTGTYEITYTYSPKFNCQMPLLNNVKGFDGIRIHAGNTAKDTDGCILVGKNNVKGKVTESKATFLKVNDLIKGRIKSGDKVYIIVKSNYT